MKSVQKALILLVVGGTVLAVLWMKQSQKRTGSPAVTAIPVQTSLPRFVDLGADKCTSCKLMIPILAELGTTYSNQFQVTFIDVWKNEEAGAAHGISMIPTQIFFDADGQELYRHEGFFAKEDILLKWKELGYDFP